MRSGLTRLVDWSDEKIRRWATTYAHALAARGDSPIKALWEPVLVEVEEFYE